MKPKIIRAEDLEEKTFGGTKVTNILDEDQWPYFNLAKIVKVGDDIKTGYDTESNVVYYVLEGEGTCVLDKEVHRIKKGDCIVIPKGTEYKNLKGLTLLEITSPRFSRDKRVYGE